MSFSDLSRVEKLRDDMWVYFREALEVTGLYDRKGATPPSSPMAEQGRIMLVSFTQLVLLFTDLSQTKTQVGSREVTSKQGTGGPTDFSHR